MVVVLTEKDVEGLYGSKSYSAPDLGDRKPKKTVSHVRKEMMPARDGKPPREKIVLSFENDKKDRQPLKSRVHRCLKALEAAKMVKQFRGQWKLMPAGKEAVGDTDD